MVRNILDYQDNVIGQLELPDDTPEEVWQEKLAKFKVAPPSPEEQMHKALERKVSQSRAFADEIIEEFKRQNLAAFIQNNIPNDLAIMISLHVHSRMRALDVTIGGVPFTIDLMNLVVSGDLETAWVVLGAMTPDDMSMPYHWFSQARIDSLRALVADRIQF